MMMTDMRHMPKDVLAPDVSPATRTLTEYLRSIVQSIRGMQPGVEGESLVQCRRRPSRLPCKTLLAVCVQEVPSQIHWRCPACGDAGVITHWQEANLDPALETSVQSPADARALSGGQPGGQSHANRPASHPSVQMTVSNKEYQELQKATIYGPGQAIIQKAKSTRDGMRMQGKPQDWKDLLGWLAGEINHEHRQSRMLLLNNLYEEIEGTLADYGYTT